MENKAVSIIGIVLIIVGAAMIKLLFFVPNMFAPNSLELAQSYQIVIKSMAYVVGALSFVIVGVGLLKISKFCLRILKHFLSCVKPLKKSHL